jgi:hypothetical protein
MFIQKNLRKLWLDTRLGTQQYLMLLLVMVNFILIMYNYFIEKNTMTENLIPNLWLFSIIFIVFYLPISILIGRWHTQTQLHIEQDLKIPESPLLVKMFRTILDVQTGKAPKEEIEEFRNMLSKIEGKNSDNNKTNNI